jgi:hypothetical protein
MGNFRLSCALCSVLCGLACSVRGEEAAERPISFLDQLRGNVPKPIFYSLEAVLTHFTLLEFARSEKCSATFAV